MAEFYMWFADLHWFIEFCIVWLAGCIAGVVFKIINRVLRSIKVLVRGWSPAHLDADGDWKPEPEQEE